MAQVWHHVGMHQQSWVIKKKYTEHKKRVKIPLAPWTWPCPMGYLVSRECFCFAGRGGRVPRGWMPAEASPSHAVGLQCGQLPADGEQRRMVQQHLEQPWQEMEGARSCPDIRPDPPQQQVNKSIGGPFPSPSSSLPYFFVCSLLWPKLKQGND